MTSLNPKHESFQETDSVLDYPDSHLAESGNRHVSHEDDFKNLTVVTNGGGRHEPSRSGDNESWKDPWDAPELTQYFEDTWAEKTSKEKCISVLWIVAKVLAALLLLYVFLCSLDLMSISLRLIAGRSASNFVANNSVMKYPIAGILIGLFFTVLVQSSSTATSVVVSMVAAELFTVREAIPFVMGANIGTSITSSIVAFTQVKDRAQFQRAFAGATIHDMFNALTTVVLVIVEVTTHYLENITREIVNSSGRNDAVKVEFLGTLTKPLIHKILKIDKSIENCWIDPSCNSSKANATSMIDTKHDHIFKKTTMSDGEVGGLMFVVSIIIISTVLIFMVKILSSVLKGQIAKMVKKIVGTKVPYCPCLTGYIAILVGAALTFIMQSSSVFTSALTPLVGIGVLRLDVMYPLTLGANVGTTGTAILAAFAVDAKKFKSALQIALCHLFFNLSGILIFYPLPFMRWPIYFAKKLGKTTAKYRWVALLYILSAFLLLPGFLLALSFASEIAVIVVVAVLIHLLAFTAIVNFLQETHPTSLPKRLQNWNYLPLHLRSFEPYDRFFLKCKCYRQLQDKTNKENLSRKTSHVTVPTKSLTVVTQPSNISLSSFPIGTEPVGRGRDENAK